MYTNLDEPLVKDENKSSNKKSLNLAAKCLGLTQIMLLILYAASSSKVSVLPSKTDFDAAYGLFLVNFSF